MAIITGPKIRMPGPISRMTDDDGKVDTDWAAFFSGVQQTTFNVSRSGPTASRPTLALKGRYIGMPYFDITLQQPIFLVSTTPADIWKDASGAVV